MSSSEPAPEPVASRAAQYAGVLGALALAVSACEAPLPASETRWRSERADGIAAAILPAARASFAGLAFYPFDKAYKVRAMITVERPPQALQIAASDGRQRPAHRIGRVRLRLPGGAASLAVYSLDDLEATSPGHLFLPFRDAGAGRETYGAGRYVEIEHLPGGVVEIDFNRAYNPDCAYGIVAQCPITPAENTLAFVVGAGEKLPPGAGH